MRRTGDGELAADLTAETFATTGTGVAQARNCVELTGHRP